MSTQNQLFTVTISRESEEEENDLVLAEVLYANEVLADECIAWVTSKVKSYLTPEAAQGIIDRIQKTPYVPPSPVTEFNPEDVDVF